MRKLFLFLMMSVIQQYSFAHSPHDNVDAIILSPDYNNDKTLFIAISDHVLKSEDGGVSWKELVNGIDSRHLVSSLSISGNYRETPVILFSTKGDGVYKSSNGGQSWKNINSGLQEKNISRVTISPGNAGHYYAFGESGGVFESTNAGDSWDRQEKFKDSLITSIGAGSDGTIYIGDNTGNLFSSKDSGDWKKLATLASKQAITSIAVSPDHASDGIIVLGSIKGVWLSRDHGRSFTLTENSLSKLNIISIAIQKLQAGLKFYATTWYDAVYHSNDMARTWKKSASGLTTDVQADTKKYMSPHFREISFSNKFKEDKTAFLAGFDGLFVSSDAARSWSQLETLPVGLIKGMGVTKNRDRNVVGLATYGGGGYISEDNGMSWTISNRGLKTTRLSDVVFSPDYSNDRTLYSGAYGALLKSTDGGKSWQHIDLQAKNWRVTLSKWLKKIKLVDLGKKLLKKEEVVPPYPNVIVVSPNFANDNTILFSTRWHGLYFSSDAGKTSTRIWDSLGSIITTMAVTDNYPDDKTIFASVRGKGIYKSTDNGKTWQGKNNGFDFIKKWGAKIDHAIKQKDIAFVLSPDFKNDKTMMAGTSSGIYITDNAGDNWRSLGEIPELKNGYVQAMAFSPLYNNDKTMLVSIKGSGLFISRDAGSTFLPYSEELIKSNHSIELLAFSGNYGDDKTLFAASDENLFVSKNDGQDWSIIKRPSRYENIRDALEYTGDWRRKYSKEYSANSVDFSDNKDDSVQLRFSGRMIKWLGSKGPDLGVVTVYLDGKHHSDIDLYNKEELPLAELLEIRNLSGGPHLVKLVVSGRKNQDSQGQGIEHDAFDVYY